MLNALIIDDESPSRQELRALLEEYASDIEILDECANALEGLAAIHRLHPDLIFLDIQMPQINALEMLSMVEASVMPRVIFVSAHEEYALRAFEEHALDYLLKPVDPQRFMRTIEWVRQTKSSTQDVLRILPHLQRIPCRALQRIILIALDDVEYVYSAVSGVHVVAGEREGITELNLKFLEERSPLLRCHRQYLVNPKKVAEIILLDNGTGEILTQSNKRIPVSRRHLRELTTNLCAK